MKRFYIVKDGTGGKLCMNTSDDKEHEEKYLTNTELKQLYEVLSKYFKK